METVDQSDSRIETCDIVTSDPPSSISSGTDKALAPTPSQDSTSTAEPLSSQERKVLSNEIRPETSQLIVPEPTASKTRRNRQLKPKPNLSRASRTTQREAAEGVTSSAETFSAPVRDVESQISTLIDFIPEAPSEPEPEEQKSGAERENDQPEACISVQSLEEMMEVGDSGKRTCVVDERKEETQQARRYIALFRCLIMKLISTLKSVIFL